MPNIFRVTSSEGGKLQLEAAAPHTDYIDTIFHAAGNLDKHMQLELDLFPEDPEEELGFTVGQTVRLVSLDHLPTKPKPEPEPATEPQPKLLRKLGVQF